MAISNATWKLKLYCLFNHLLTICRMINIHKSVINKFILGQIEDNVWLFQIK